MKTLLDNEQMVRDALTLTIRSSMKSREQIAEEMSELLGAKVTLRMLNSYTAGTAEQHRFPLQFVGAFCLVTSDWSLMDDLASSWGLRLIGSEDQKHLELGRQILIQKRAAANVARLEEELAEAAL